MSEPTEIDAILKERGRRYGDFKEHAIFTQNIKCAIRLGRNWPLLSDDQRESLEMIAHKIGRIVNGDPDYRDSWDDIAGYAILISRSLEPKP